MRLQEQSGISMPGFVKSMGGVVLALVLIAGISAAWYYDRERRREQVSVRAEHLRLVMAELLKTVQEDIGRLNSAGEGTLSRQDLLECDRTVKALECWLRGNDVGLPAAAGAGAGNLDEKTRTELADMGKKLRSLTATLAAEVKPKLAQLPDKPAPVESSSCETGSSEPILTKWINRSTRIQATTNPDVPDKVLSTLVERYTNPEIRWTSYYFKNIKVIRAVRSNKPGVYCISFQADVIQRTNDSRWPKSPVVLNVIVADTPEGVLSTYENFAEKQWEFPRDGACVHSVWGVSDYEWCETCPYPCMSSYSPIFSQSSTP